MVYLLVEFCQYLLPEITHDVLMHDVTMTRMQIWNALFMDPQFDLPTRNIPTLERLSFVGDIIYLFIVDLRHALMS